MATEQAVDDRGLAELALYDFRATKRALLRNVVVQELDSREIVKRLRKRYEVLMRRHLKLEGTTYSVWIMYGPKPELDELVEAARDAAVWDRLVETYERRFAPP